MNPENKIWIEPDYYKNFHCKCGSCRHPCCNGWQIGISMDEYFRLIGLEASPALHHRLETAFVAPDFPSPEKYRIISPNYEGRCPMLDEDGLCLLQKEQGETVLPTVCRLYPRSMKAENGEKTVCCSGSCEGVIELLMDEDVLSFLPREEAYTPSWEEKVPEHLATIGKAVTPILQDRSTPLSHRLAYVADLLRGDGAHSPIPTDRKNAIAVILAASRRLMRSSHELADYCEAAANRYGEGDDVNELLYAADAAAFASRFPLWERWFENFFVNHLFYSALPCVDDRLKAEDTTAGVCLGYGMMRLYTIALGTQDPTRDGFVNTVSGLFHLIEHTPFYYNARVLIKEPLALLAM